MPAVVITDNGKCRRAILHRPWREAHAEHVVFDDFNLRAGGHDGTSSSACSA
jgi:hypothetical protein